MVFEWIAGVVNGTLVVRSYLIPFINTSMLFESCLTYYQNVSLQMLHWFSEDCFVVIRQ